jgi:type III pantothenate kinase
LSFFFASNQIRTIFATRFLKLTVGALAQLVEQRTENPCVPGSIPGGTTSRKGCLNGNLFSLLHVSAMRFVYIYRQFYNRMIALVLDIGNTALKAACFDGKRLLKAGRAAADDHSGIEELMLKLLVFMPEHYFMAQVARVPDALEKFLIRAKLPGTSYNPTMTAGLKNRYLTPETLGCDRLANAAAAHSLSRSIPCLVIDAGTCIKFDFVNADGEYLGGSIAPGIDMRFKALNSFTSRLPLFQKNEHAFLVGRNTEESIQSGVINGAVAEIKGMLDQYQMAHKDLKVFLTGGDSPLFERNLKSTIFADAWLTLKGLNEIRLLQKA